MDEKQIIKTGGRYVAAGAGLAIGAYAAYFGMTWLRFGHPEAGSPAEADPLLDRFMPVYEVVERHHVEVHAPAETTFAAACEMDLLNSAAIRAIFRARLMILGGAESTRSSSRGLLAQAKAWGWGVLVEEPGHEIVLGAVTQPWHANPAFRALSVDEFSAFHEPDYVKIAWTLRADSTGAGTSVFRTETRVVTTDAGARAKFRLYWSCFSPGIRFIRRLSLAPLKVEAERRARELALL